MLIVYESKTGNVQRFMNKVEEATGWRIEELSKELILHENFHLVTYTTGIGHIPNPTKAFMVNNHSHALSVTTSGNMNWGQAFGGAGDKLSELYNIPLLMKFELSGTPNDIKKFIDLITNYHL